MNDWPPNPGLTVMISSESIIQKRLDQTNGRRRIDGQSDFLTERADLPNQRTYPFAQLDVNVHLIGTGACERFQKDLRLGTHQVDIEKELCQRRKVFTTAGPKEMFCTKWPSMISRCSQSARRGSPAEFPGPNT